jgi:transposase
MRRAIALHGSRKSPKPACAAGPRCTTSNSTRCLLLHQQMRRELLAESRKHDATKLLRQIPAIGPIRAALLLALLQTPHRFRTKRQLWAYSGLALKTSVSGEYRFVEGQIL